MWNEESSEADKEKKEKIDLKNQADLICYQTEKQVKEYGEKLPLKKKEPIFKEINNIKEILQTDEFDNELLKTKMEELQKLAQIIGEEISNSTSSDSTEQSKTNDDGTVIDTDFTDDDQ